MDKDFAVGADLAWSPDGKKLIGLVITRRPGTKGRGEGPIAEQRSPGCVSGPFQRVLNQDKAPRPAARPLAKQAVSR
jgi:hypothetical protein